MPILTCKVYDFELSKEDKIYQEYLELLNSRRDMTNIGHIFVDINKKVSCIMSIRYVDKDGIKIKKVIEKSNKEQIKKEVQDLKKAKEINKYKKSSYLKAEYDENNELVFFNGQEQIDIDKLYSECLHEARKEYLENINKIKKLYIDNKSILERYSSIINKMF